MIDGAELIIYDENGDDFTIELSATQLAVCIKILGIEANNDYYTSFSDDTLKRFSKMKGNPLSLKETQKIQTK